MSKRSEFVYEHDNDYVPATKVYDSADVEAAEEMDQAYHCDTLDSPHPSLAWERKNRLSMSIH
jgi:hypothetical protein